MAVLQHRYWIDIRAMLRIALPLALAELGWMAMGVVDTIMVGRLPNSAVTIGATSIGGALFYTIATFALGLTSGIDPLVAQALGSRNLPETRRVFASALTLALLMAPLFTGLIFAAVPFLAIAGVSEPVRASAADFVNILAWSLPLLLFYTVCRRFLQGLHHVRVIPAALIGANLFNVLGNWVLIYGHWGAPALGVRGSALSTVLARIFLALVLGLAVHLQDPLAFRRLRPARAIGLRLIQLGLPAGATIALEVGVFSTSTVLAGRLNPASLAAHTIALNASSITWMVALGLSSAAAVATGRAFGAGDRHAATRAGWTAIALVTLYELGAAASFLLFPRQIAHLYSADPAVIAVTIPIFAIAALFQVFDGLQTVAAGALRGFNNTRAAMTWTLFGYWVIGLPVGYWLCFGLGWGVPGLWYGLCLALILIGVGLTSAWHLTTRH